MVYKSMGKMQMFYVYIYINVEIYKHNESEIYIFGYLGEGKKS